MQPTFSPSKLSEIKNSTCQMTTTTKPVRMFSSKLFAGLKRPNVRLDHSFLNPSSSQYIEAMYNAWLKDPASVHLSWDAYFRNSAYQSPPNLNPALPSLKEVISSLKPAAADDQNIMDHLAVQGVIRSYQARGHLVANLDPLGLMENAVQKASLPIEILKSYNLEDLDKVYTLPPNTYIGGKDKKLPLREILRRLEAAYCRHIGVEYIYLDERPERIFLRKHLEPPGILELSQDRKMRTLKRLIHTSDFENFLAKKWASEKRFGLEGCDMLIPGIQQIIDKSTELGVEHFFIGIAHRGRLNLLANVFEKPLYQIFNQFVSLEPGDIGSGDVKYHYGSHGELVSEVTHKTYKVTILANPSHLEVVNACVVGRTRAEQELMGDTEGKKSLAILIHGDAAICGQGVNYEALSLAYLPHYTTHGVVCMVVNNQIGFTTDARSSRSSRYCTDIGRVTNAPIFHVNADDPESVVHVCNVAAQFRHQFGKDIVIDLVGYRRHGHNEADEPMFTQPIMYTKISQLKPVVKQYKEKLLSEKVITENEIKNIEEQYLKFCEAQYQKASEQTQIFISDWLDTPWSGFFEGKDPLKMNPTGVPLNTLMHIAEQFSALPPDNIKFQLHKSLVRVLGQRKQNTDEKLADWAMGEAFAIGTLLKEGVAVRLSGEDVERGTFSHRHHVLHDQKVDKLVYEPIKHLYSDQAKYTVCNSSLSEYGVLAFEVGYSLANPNALTIWEAQFGDFFNTAQPVFDQFLSSGETKWSRQNGIVCLLPHGFEGMGSEHSSGRIERFLQMCDDDRDILPDSSPMQQLRDCNWIIANCSTPANLFHILRRQIYLPFRKPLILFTPKSLLKLKACRSPFSEMVEGTEFRSVIPDHGEAGKNPNGVKKLLFCSGKAYYDIVEVRKDKNLEGDIAVVRVEQLFPFPYDLIREQVEKYKNARIVWAQEEPKNAGAYEFVIDRFNTLLKGERKVEYCGRAPSASPATGIKAHHKQEVKMLSEAYVQL